MSETANTKGGYGGVALSGAINTGAQTNDALDSNINNHLAEMNSSDAIQLDDDDNNSDALDPLASPMKKKTRKEKLKEKKK